jgi:hypothetical protein
MKWFIMLTAALYLWPATAHPASLKRFAIQWEKYPFYTHFAALPDEQVRESLAVVFDVDLGARFSWKNRVESLSTDSQFRYVSWEYALSWQVLPSLAIIPWHHKSEHLLGRNEAGTHFPVRDGMGLEWTIYEHR